MHRIPRVGKIQCTKGSKFHCPQQYIREPIIAVTTFARNSSQIARKSEIPWFPNNFESKPDANRAGIASILGESAHSSEPKKAN